MSSLPVPLSPVDHHAPIGRRHLLELGEQRSHHGALADHLVALFDVGAELLDFALQLPRLERVAHGDQHTVTIERLLEEVGRTELHRLHRFSYRCVPGNHEDGKASSLGLVSDLRECFDAAHLRQPNVENDQVDFVAVELFEALLRG